MFSEEQEVRKVGKQLFLVLEEFYFVYIVKMPFFIPLPFTGLLNCCKVYVAFCQISQRIGDFPSKIFLLN